MALSRSFDPNSGGESAPQLVDWPNLGETSPKIVVCPHCGHHVSVFIDTAAGEGHEDYVEDCPLCCRPMELHVDVRDYLVTEVQAERGD